MITEWIVNRFRKHLLRIWNIVSLLQWPLTQLLLAYCRSSKCPPLARMHAGVKMRFAINCILLKAMPNVQQFLNVVNSWLVHALLDKAVN